MKRITSILVIAVILISAAAVSASAERTPLFMGDVSQDHSVNMEDVTLLQRYIAEISKLSKRGLVAADANQDEKINMEDVVTVQKFVARITEVPYIVGTHAQIRGIMSNIYSGKAAAGDTVKFFVVNTRGYKPLSYEFFVDGKLVRERKESDEFEYKFEKEGKYEIKAVVYNSFDETAETKIEYEVVKSLDSDKPLLKSIDLSYASGYKYFATDCESSHKFYKFEVYDIEDYLNVTVEAFMGKGPYEYRFYFDGEDLTGKYSSENSVNISLRCEHGGHTLTVNIKDDNGAETSEDIPIFLTSAPRG